MEIDTTIPHYYREFKSQHVMVPHYLESDI